MTAQKRRSHQGLTGGFGRSNESAELGRLGEDHNTTLTDLPFRAAHLPLAVHALAIRDTAGITQALLVKAWAHRVRAALGCRL